jgi:hypothetical protein
MTEYTEYITPDGETYRFDTHDKFLLSETGLGMPPVSYITSRSPTQHGETVLDYRLGTRVIQLVHRRNACNREDYWANRGDLLDMIRPNRNGISSYNLGRLRKIFSDGSKRDIYVTIEQGPEFAARDTSRWDEWAFTETIRFIAHDPLFFDPVQKSANLTLASNSGLTFPFSLPLLIEDDKINLTLTCTTEGTEDTFPNIVLTGPMSGVLVRNTSLDLEININYNISDGEIVTVYLQPGNKRIVSDLVGDITGVGYALSDLATFRLAPHPKVTNGDNIIHFHGAGIAPFGNTAISMNWLDRYIGI